MDSPAVRNFYVFPLLLTPERIAAAGDMDSARDYDDNNAKPSKKQRAADKLHQAGDRVDPNKDTGNTSRKGSLFYIVCVASFTVR